MTRKLSELIRQGAEYRPQCRNAFFRQNAEGVLCSDALGAAYEALTGSTTWNWADVELTIRNSVDLPVWEYSAQEIISEIFIAIRELTDIRDWSRKQIADWLQEQGL